MNADRGAPISRVRAARQQRRGAQPVQVKITGGALRGRRITVEPDVRATSEKVRQAYFDIIGGRIRGARFLDLFGGSGIFSFEAVSRGAVAATLVEIARRSTARIQRVVDELELPVRVVCDDVIHALGTLRSDEAFDLVFADPPWDYPGYESLLGALEQVPLSAGALVGVEHRTGADGGWSPSLTRLRRLRTASWGDTSISFFEEARMESDPELSPGTHDGGLRRRPDGPEALTR